MQTAKKGTVLACLLISTLLLAGCSQREEGSANSASSTGALSSAAAEATPEVTPVPVYTVSFALNGTTLCTEQVEEGSMPTLPDTDESDNIIGWLDENGEEISPDETVIQTDRTFTARLSTDLLKNVYYLEAEGGLFRPADKLTRQECALMLYELLPEKPEIPEELPSEPAELVLGLNAQKAYEEAEAAAAAEEDTPEVAYVVNGTAFSEIEEAMERDLNGTSEETAEQTETGEEPEATAEPVDLGPTDYEKFAAIVSAGYMDAREDGSLYPRDAVTVEEFRAILSKFFSDDALDDAFSSLNEGDLQRIDAATVMNTLLGRTVPADNKNGSYPDVDEDFFLLDSIRAAAKSSDTPEEGMLLLSNGQLYYITEEGTCLKDDDVGTMHFGTDGRYTSGSDELDELVCTAIANHVNVADDHETQLRSVYDYIRDNFAYLRRNYYKQGEHGWEIEEATFLLANHKGNCYSFAAGLWALARGIGYDAGAISGEIGENYTQHGWVYITLEDGVCYFFDVEIEYAALRDGATNYPMWKLPWSGATANWTYTYDWNVEGFPKY